MAIQLRLYPGSSTIKLFNQNVDNNEHMNLTYKVFTQNLLDKKTTTTITKYSRLIPDQSSYIRQPESGIVYNPKEFVSFWSNITTTDVSNTAFIIEIRINNNNDNEVHKNAVNGYIRPFNANETNGFRKIPLLNSSSQNVVGEIEGDDFFFALINQ